MGFSLQAVDSQGQNKEEYEYVDHNRATWFELREVLILTRFPYADDEPEVMETLAWNNGHLVTPEQSRWLAGRVAHADRERIPEQVPEAEELIGLLDDLGGFFERCAGRGGFEVW